MLAARATQLSSLQIERYNSAVELANSGDFSGARRLLWELQAEEDLTSDLKRAVQEALRQLHKVM